MSDPFRENPLSLEQWLDTFREEREDRAEYQDIQQAAVSLQRSAVFNRVMNKIEAGVVQAMLGCSAADDIALVKFKLQLTGIQAVRKELRMLAEDKDFEKKRSIKE